MSTQCALKTLSSVTNLYRELARYSDRGWVREWISPVPSDPSTKIVFATWYVAPSHFRFECSGSTRLAIISNPAQSYVVSQDDGNKRRLWRCAGVKEALGMVAGVTAASGYRIARLLMPDLGGPPTIDLVNPAAEELPAVQGGVIVRGVSAYDGAGVDVRIDRNRCTVGAFTRHDKNKVTHEVRRWIRLNPDIDMALFAVDKL